MAFAKARGWPGKGFPTVKYMADSSGHSALYDYLYSATSKWVHFAPGQLVRLGWANMGPSDVCEDTVFTFSTKHFRRYYEDFNWFYAVYLLVHFCRKFIGEFREPKKVERLLDRLEKFLEEPNRWPEVLTFEEMNLRPPGPLLTTLTRLAYEKKMVPSDLKSLTAEEARRAKAELLEFRDQKNRR